MSTGRKEKPYKIGDHTVQMEEILESGHTDGWKIHIDHKKYPREYGYWYGVKNKEKALKMGWEEFKRKML